MGTQMHGKLHDDRSTATGLIKVLKMYVTYYQSTYADNILNSPRNYDKRYALSPVGTDPCRSNPWITPLG